MKKLALKLFASIFATLWASSALATQGDGGFIDWIYRLILFFSKIFHKTHDSGGGGGNAVPELDAFAAPLAIALLAGIVSIGFEIRRRSTKS